MSEAKFKTMRHIETVRNFLSSVIIELVMRGVRHDQSKLESPEIEYLEKYTPKLRGLTYGSEEYQTCMAEMKPGIEHHYKHNSHHPEHYLMWECVVCHRVCKDQEKIKYFDQTDIFYCPVCCKNSIIFECSLKPASGFWGMNLLDLIEMMCDWKAAGLRHDNGDLFRSIEINQKRYGFSDELADILRNTAVWINAHEPPHKAGES